MTSDGSSQSSLPRGSSLAFVRPMPKRDESLQALKESSFEMAVLQPEARSAVELWCQLQPEDAEGSYPRTSITSCTLGHFRVEEQIGRGGMGAVYRAVDTRLDRVVALKVLSPSQSNDHGSIERFRNEARAAARMDHDNIARVYYVGEDQGLWFIAFEFVHGSNVKQVIDRRGALTPADSVNYTLQIAQALLHTDAAGVVHRDIKPSNIIITPAGRAKLVDLGLARKRDPEASNELTVDGTTLGTFDYISPEQAKDPKNVDVRSDIYSLGCTLFHMLTGEPPYPKGTMLQKLLDHQAKGIPDAAEKNPRVPSELSTVVRKMMASDPDDRYASPERLIDDLKLMAHLCGLQPATASGEIWVTSPGADGWELWRQYGGWIMTAALLLIVVFMIDFAQRMPTSVASLAPLEDIKTKGLAANQLANDAESPPPSEPLPAPPPPQRIDIGLSQRDGAGRQDLEPTPAGNASPPTSPPGHTEGGPRQTGSPAVPAIGQTPFVEPDPLFNNEFPTPLTDQLPVRVSDTLSDPLEEPVEEVTGEVVSRGEGENRANLPGPRGSEIPASTPDEPFVVWANGMRRNAYPTLEAACADAPNDASIELAFNGDKADVQAPLRIEGKHLLIRPAQGMRPTLRFAAPPEWRLGRLSDTANMIEVTRGWLEIYNMDIRLEVTPELNIPQWTVIALTNAKELSLRGVSITTENAGTRSVAMIELKEPVGLPFDESPLPPVQIDAEDCFFRGQADLFLDHNVDPAAIRLSNVALALDGTLLRIEGTDQRHVDTDMNEEHVVELELKHVTAWLADGLADFNVQSNFSVPKLKVDASDSVVVVASSQPLVNMQGEMDLQDFEDRLEWTDQATYLHALNLMPSDPVWRISVPGRTRNFDHDEFDSRWNRRQLFTPGSIGELLAVQPDVPFAEVTRRELQLQDHAEQSNPAISGATDRSDAGVDWGASRLPPLQPSSDNLAPDRPSD